MINLYLSLSLSLSFSVWEHSMVTLYVLSSRKSLVYCVEKQLLGEHMTSILQKGEPGNMYNLHKSV